MYNHGLYDFYYKRAHDNDLNITEIIAKARMGTKHMLTVWMVWLRSGEHLTLRNDKQN